MQRVFFLEVGVIAVVLFQKLVWMVKVEWFFREWVSPILTLQSGNRRDSTLREEGRDSDGLTREKYGNSSLS